MSCNIRSVPPLVDDLVGGLELWSRNTCTFLTFGKVPTVPRSAVVPPSTIRNTRPQRPTAMTNDSDVCATGSGRERKSSTETGPSDPSALRPSSESTPRVRCSSPDDDDDVFPVADVGCSSVAFSRSTSVPPRRAHSCAQPPLNYEVSTSSVTTATKISPPRMKRRKKKSAGETDLESRKTASSTSSGADNLAMPAAARCGNKVKDVTAKQPKKDETENNTRDGESLQMEQPDSEQVSSREDGSASRETETKRKKNIRWKMDVAQSSPDVASDDADSKESGYITLEDLQAQLGLSSWSSDERQTDQEVFSSSGDELRAPEGLCREQSRSSAAFGEPSTGLLVPPPSFLSPLIPPEQFDTLGREIDCCRSAPPTCDASLLKFTFTVRLDSKMFHRRVANRAVRRPMMLTDVQQRGQCGTATGGDKELPEPTNSRTNDQTRAVVEKASSETTDNHSSPTTSGPSQNTHISAAATVSTTASTSPRDSKLSSSTSAQQFDGEKVVVRAEVHRSADQLDADAEPPKTSNTSGSASNSHGMKTKSSAVQFGTSSQKAATRPSSGRYTALSTSCQPDDRITSCSPDAEFLDRQCSVTTSVHHDRPDQLTDGGFNGRINYVDVDRVMSQAAKLQTIYPQPS